MTAAPLLHAPPVPGPHLPGTPCAALPQAGNPTAPWDCRTCRTVAAESGETDPWTTAVPIALAAARVDLGPDSGPDRVEWHPPTGGGPHLTFSADLVLSGRRWRLGTGDQPLCSGEGHAGRNCLRCQSLTAAFRTDLVRAAGSATGPFDPVPPTDPQLTTVTDPVILRARTDGWHWRDIITAQPDPVTGQIIRRNVVACGRTARRPCYDCAALVASTVRRIRDEWATSAPTGGDGRSRTAVDLAGARMPAGLVVANMQFAIPGQSIAPADAGTSDTIHSLWTKGPAATTHLRLDRFSQPDPDGTRWEASPTVDRMVCGRRAEGLRSGRGRRACRNCLASLMNAIPRTHRVALGDTIVDLDWARTDPLGPSMISAVMSSAR